MKRAALIAALLLLAGCATTPPAPQVIRVTPPASLTEPEAAPSVPGPDATQKDVARYLLQLHQWGQDGWDRLDAIRQWEKNK